jgi:small subunit ribosomal protein S1
MATSPNPTRDDFAAMLDESLGGADGGFEGRVVKGTVTAIDNDHAVIDVGLKSEGRVALREFAMPGQKADLKVGDEVEVFVDRVENMNGEAMLSRDRARREAAWDVLEGEFDAGNRVDGVIFGRVKGGFTVDLSGAVAFLPGSQVDVRPVRDVAPLMDIAQPFVILKMDRKRGNIVVSRRAILEETRAEQRTGLIQNLAEGQIIDGVVKNITDYGAFVDLGGIDGLLHVTDISYKRINHPSEVINIGDTVKVQIVRINKDTQRISLGMKQLESDPWDAAVAKYPVGARLTGAVTNITEYGAFIELEAEPVLQRVVAAFAYRIRCCCANGSSAQSAQKRVAYGKYGLVIIDNLDKHQSIASCSLNFIARGAEACSKSSIVLTRTFSTET